MPLSIDVFSDLACPWCFIGERRLHRVLREAYPGAQVRRRAYQLQPDLPPEGVDADEFFTRKFGGRAAMQHAFDRVTLAGREEGIRFDFGKMKRAPNTRLAQRALALARPHGLEHAASDAFFRGHFEEGEDISQLPVLLELLRRHQVPLDLKQLQADLSAGAGEDEVKADLELGRRLGVTGVPLFVANGAVAVSGAQPVEVFRAFLDRAQGEAQVALDEVAR